MGNLYDNFLKNFNMYQSPESFDDNFQYFLCGMFSEAGQELFIENIKSIAITNNKNVFIVDNINEAANFNSLFKNNLKQNLDNELYIIKLYSFNDEDCLNILKEFNNIEFDLRKNNFRVVFSTSVHQYQKFISRTEFFQFRSATYFDVSDLITKHNLFKDLNNELTINKENKTIKNIKI